MNKKISYRKIFSNLIVEYSLITFIATFVIALLLSSQIREVIEQKTIELHSSFYIDYISSIPVNYEELYEIFENPSHSELEHNIEHFEQDLLLFQSMGRIRFYNKDGKIVWESIVRDQILNLENELNSPLITTEKFNYSIIQNDDSTASLLIIYIPIFKNGIFIGTAEILDHDQRSFDTLRSVNNKIIKSVGVAGIVFYLLMFFLFFRSYKLQNRSIKRLEMSQNVTIFSMSLLAELRDNETGDHINRTKEYCRLLAYELRKNRKYRKYLKDSYIVDLVRSAPLHDIGKVGIPDKILLKPGKLTKGEFEIMKKHTFLGEGVLLEASQNLDFQSYLEIGRQIVLHHHENWDGSGYPSGLEGYDIPLSARIMALADVYDALRSERPYKKSMDHLTAVKIIESESGTKFDPDIVRAFISIESDFSRVSHSSLKIELDEL